MVAVDVDGIRYLVSTSDVSVGRTLFVRQHRMEMRLLRRALKLTGQPRTPDAVFLDVGANIGTTTFPAVALHGFGAAISIEPEPTNAGLLRATSALNGLTNVTVIEAAATSIPGTVPLRVYPGKSGRHRIVGHHDESTIDVTAVTLDSIDLERVEFVWMDVQHHEAEVLTGANRLIERGVPIMVEVDPAKTPERFWDLAASGYTHAHACNDPDGAPIPLHVISKQTERARDLLLVRL